MINIHQLVITVRLPCSVWLPDDLQGLQESSGDRAGMFRTERERHQSHISRAHRKIQRERLHKCNE